MCVRARVCVYVFQSRTAPVRVLEEKKRFQARYLVRAFDSKGPIVVIASFLDGQLRPAQTSAVQGTPTSIGGLTPLEFGVFIQSF